MTPIKRGQYRRHYIDFITWTGMSLDQSLIKYRVFARKDSKTKGVMTINAIEEKDLHVFHGPRNEATFLKARTKEGVGLCC
eukprot:1139753-Pelagomonas_calceolata.AAC.3